MVNLTLAVLVPLVGSYTLNAVQGVTESRRGGGRDSIARKEIKVAPVVTGTGAVSLGQTVQIPLEVTVTIDVARPVAEGAPTALPSAAVSVALAGASPSVSATCSACLGDPERLSVAKKLYAETIEDRKRTQISVEDVVPVDYAQCEINPTDHMEECKTLVLNLLHDAVGCNVECNIDDLVQLEKQHSADLCSACVNSVLKIQTFACVCYKLTQEDRNVIEALPGPNGVDDGAPTSCVDGGFNRLNQLQAASTSDESYKDIFDRYREHMSFCLPRSLQQCTEASLCSTEEQMWTTDLVWVGLPFDNEGS